MFVSWKERKIRWNCFEDKIVKIVLFRHLAIIVETKAHWHRSNCIEVLQHELPHKRPCRRSNQVDLKIPGLKKLTMTSFTWYFPSHMLKSWDKRIHKKNGIKFNWTLSRFPFWRGNERCPLYMWLSKWSASQELNKSELFVCFCWWEECYLDLLDLCSPWWWLLSRITEPTWTLLLITVSSDFLKIKSIRYFWNIQTRNPLMYSV